MERLLQQFEVASDDLKRTGTVGAVRGTLTRRNGAEARYAAAYQRLVRAGLAPQIRKRYR